MSIIDLNEEQVIPNSTRYSKHATEIMTELDRRVEAVYSEVEQQGFWRALFSDSTSNEMLRRMLKEVFLSVYWYQRHTTEAGFHMIGRLPKGEVRLIKTLCNHKAEEAEHGMWALRDFLAMGGDEVHANLNLSPATFAVTGVWWRMATIEDPFGYLGAEHLFEYLTARVTAPLVAEFQRRGFDASRAGFIVEHATEDVKHTNLIRHLIGDSVTRFPASAESMLRCFEYFHHVYPLPVWNEAYERALAE